MQKVFLRLKNGFKHCVSVTATPVQHLLFSFWRQSNAMILIGLFEHIFELFRFVSLKTQNFCQGLADSNSPELKHPLKIKQMINFDMDTPNGHNPGWTQSRMYTIPNVHDPD